MFVNKRDMADPRIEAKMFYIPKRVMNWDDQIDKWFHTFIWQFAPFDLLLVVFNAFNMMVDSWNIDASDQAETAVRYYPSMYNNDIARAVLSGENGEPFGPFKYYDLFSMGGIAKLWINRFFLDVLFLVELINASTRETNNNWSYGDPTEGFPVDQNLFGFDMIVSLISPYYWFKLLAYQHTVEGAKDDA